jgi:hypothetical protein
MRVLEQAAAPDGNLESKLAIGATNRVVAEQTPEVFARASTRGYF